VKCRVLSSLARLEAQKISRRTKAGLDRARAKGKRLGRPPSRKSVCRITSIMVNSTIFTSVTGAYSATQPWLSTVRPEPNPADKGQAAAACGAASSSSWVMGRAIEAELDERGRFERSETAETQLGR